MESLSLTYWHWLILAVVLITAETLLPGVFFLWLGFAAAALGIVLFFVPDLQWQSQLFLFSVLSVVSIGIWLKWFRNKAEETDQPMLNRRGEHYVGNVYVLENAIENGFGRVKIGDSSWRVKGQDAPSGARVEVIGVDGSVLEVKRVAD